MVPNDDIIIVITSSTNSCIGLLPAFLAILAVATSVVSTGWCETVKFSPNLDQVPDGMNITAQTQDILSNSEGFADLQFGLFYFKKVQDLQFDSVRSSYVDVTDSCVEYDTNTDIDYDVTWRIARAFAIAAPILGGLLALALLVSPCFIFFTKPTWNKMAILMLVLLPAVQGLTLLILTSDVCKSNPIIEERFDQAISVLNGGATTASDSDASDSSSSNTTTAVSAAENNNTDTGFESGLDEDVLKSIYGDCEWDWGIYAQIVSMILFFLTGVVMLMMGPPVRPEPKVEEQVVTYEQKTDENGETKVEEVQVDTYSPQMANSELPPW